MFEEYVILDPSAKAKKLAETHASLIQSMHDTNAAVAKMYSVFDDYLRLLGLYGCISVDTCNDYRKGLKDIYKKNDDLGDLCDFLEKVHKELE